VDGPESLYCRDAALHGRRNPFVAQEGVPFLLVIAALAILLIRFADPWYALIPGLLLVLFYMIFRDPHRSVPSIALGVFSPVDGKVVTVEKIEQGETGEPALRVVIDVDSFGTYTARSPVEGAIKDLGKKALWVQTDEGEDVILKFSGYRLGLAPRAFAKFGERLGQGQRCAYLRLTRTAEVQIPINGKVLVEPGQTIIAGEDVIGNVPSPR
jgi:phosphatidylserine decarboxylase